MSPLDSGRIDIRIGPRKVAGLRQTFAGKQAPNTHYKIDLFFFLIREYSESVVHDDYPGVSEA